MAEYKVPQDVEAEDKFLGPLTFKQFLFSGGALISAYVIFLLLTSGLAWLSILFLPFFVVFAVLAFPWSRDQPTDIFLASRIRFLLVPRKRIWDQTGVKDLVKITVPKKEVHVYSDGLNQDQVRSRLSSLSSMVDSRGWAVKNMDHAPSSDRLVAAMQTPATVDETDLGKTEDMLDQQSGQSSHIASAIQESEDEHRKHTLDLVAEARMKSKQLDKSVLNEPVQSAGPVPIGVDSPSSTPQSDPVLDSVSLPKVDASLSAMKKQEPQREKPSKSQSTTVGMSSDEEQALLDKLHKKQATDESIESHSHLKTVQPISNQTTQQDDNGAASASSATPVDPAILSLAQNDDRSIESLAREANKDSGDLSDNEVTVSLR